MNSAMTITQWEVDNSNRESAKPAKLSQEKVYNLDNQRRKFHASNVETANQLKNAGIQSKDFLDKFKMAIINNGHIVVKLNSGRKLKVKRMVSDGTVKFYSEAISEGNAIEIPVVVNTNPVVNEPVQQVESNIREFPSRATLQTSEFNRNESVSKQPASIMYDFATGAPISPTRAVANNDNTLTNSVENNNSTSTLSRLSRMDYNANVSSKEEPRAVKVSHNDSYSIEDYWQKASGVNAGTNNDDIGSILHELAKIDSEAQKVQSATEQVVAQIGEVDRAKQAKRDELNELLMSKTAMLTGLKEQLEQKKAELRRSQQELDEMSRGSYVA